MKEWSDLTVSTNPHLKLSTVPSLRTAWDWSISLPITNRATMAVTSLSKMSFERTAGNFYMVMDTCLVFFLFLFLFGCWRRLNKDEDHGDGEDVLVKDLSTKFKLLSTREEKKPKHTAKNPSPDKEKAVVTPKPTKTTKTSKTQKSKETTSSRDQKAVHVPTLLEETKIEAREAKESHIALEKLEKDKANGAPQAKEKGTAKKAKKAKALEVEKSSLRRSPMRSAKRTRSPAGSAKRKTREALSERKPAATKSKTADRIASDPHSFVRKRVAKDFDGDVYFGTVVEYDDAEVPAYWHVEYDDKDREDYCKKDLAEALKYYEVTGKGDRRL